MLGQNRLSPHHRVAAQLDVEGHLAQLPVAIHEGFQQPRVLAAQAARLVHELVGRAGLVDGACRVVAVGALINRVVESAAPQQAAQVVMLDLDLAQHVEPVVDEAVALEVAGAVVVVEVRQVGRRGVIETHRAGVADGQRGVDRSAFAQLEAGPATAGRPIPAKARASSRRVWSGVKRW
jgi:hypothetical protein